MKGMGTVVSLKGNRAVVRVSPSSECAGCGEKGHCISSKQADRDITVLNDLAASVSDRVVFEAEGGKVVLASVLVWIVPIIAMIAGYAFGKRIGGGAAAIPAAIGFLALAFGALALIDRAVSGGRMFYPRITAILTPGDEGTETCG